MGGRLLAALGDVSSPCLNRESFYTARSEVCFLEQEHDAWKAVPQDTCCLKLKADCSLTLTACNMQNTKQMVQITAVYTMDLIWFQVVPNLTVVASTASPTRNRRSEKKTMVSKSEYVTGAKSMSIPPV